MPFQNLIAIGLGCLLFSTTCHSTLNRSSGSMSDRPDHVVLRPTKAVLHETTERAGDLTTTKINIEEGASGAGTIQREIDKAQFVNSRIGWAETLIAASRLPTTSSTQP